MRKLYKSIFLLILGILLSITDLASADSESLFYPKEISRAFNQLKDEPHNGKICNTIGFYFYKMEDYRNAAQYYLKAIELAPEYPLSYNNLGVIYLKMEEYESAEKCFHKAIELDPKYIKAVCNLGVTCFKVKNYSEAKKWYKIAEKINPEYVKIRKGFFLNKKPELRNLGIE